MLLFARIARVGIVVIGLAACPPRTWQGDDEMHYNESRGQDCESSAQPNTYGQSCTSADNCPEVRGGSGDHGWCTYCRRCAEITYDFYTGEVEAPGQCASCTP